MSRRHASALAATDPLVAQRVATTMQALAAPSRVRILACLAREPLAVGRLVELTAMEQPAVSQQLRVLRQLGIVVGERRGRQVIYALHDPHVADLLAEAVAHAEHHATGVRTHATEAAGEAA